MTTTNEDDKALITAPQVKKWRAAHEAAIKKAEKEEKAQTSDSETDDSETDDSETDDSETDDSETDDNDTTVGSAPSSQSGVVVPPIDTIPLKHVINRAMGNLRTIAQYPTIDPVQNHNLTLFNTALTKIAAKQIDNVSPEKAKIAFDAVYALTAILLDDNCLAKMLPTDLQNLSVTFQSLNEKAQHVLIEDEITKEVTEEDMNGVREDYEVPDDITEEAPDEIIETTLLAFQNFETDEDEEDEEDEDENVETEE